MNHTTTVIMSIALISGYFIISPIPVQASSITYGDSRFGTLITQNNTIDWQFEAVKGDEISITSQTAFDSYLELRDVNSSIIASNDDTEVSLSAAINNVEIPQAGIYSIVLYSNHGTGDYTITLTRNNVANIGGEIHDNDPQTFIVSGAGSKWYYSGQTDDYITINAKGSNIDPYLHLYGPNGMLITDDDDSGEDMNAEIYEFRLKQDGEYTIRVTNFSEGSGEVILEVTSTKKPSGGGQISVGESRSGTLTRGHAQQWTFAGKEGQMIDISMTSGECDALLELSNSDNEILMGDDDSGVDTNAFIEGFILPANDTYTISAGSYGGCDDADYQLHLTGGKVKINIEAEPETNETEQPRIRRRILH